MPKEPEDYNHVPLASYRRSYVSKDAHEKAIAAKDAEIELLKMELDGELAGRRDITKLLEGDTDEPRWKWIRIAISDLKDSLAAEATRAEFLESKCAKMREILGEIRLSLVRFRCFECGYEHYEPVDSFFCPSCGKHALGSHHFSGPSQSTGNRIDAILESEEA